MWLPADLATSYQASTMGQTNYILTELGLAGGAGLP